MLEDTTFVNLTGNRAFSCSGIKVLSDQKPLRNKIEVVNSPNLP